MDGICKHTRRQHDEYEKHGGTTDKVPKSIIKYHFLGTMNVCTNCNDNPFSSCNDILVTKVVDQQSNISPVIAKMPQCHLLLNRAELSFSVAQLM